MELKLDTKDILASLLALLVVSGSVSSWSRSRKDEFSLDLDGIHDLMMNIEELW